MLLRPGADLYILSLGLGRRTLANDLLSSDTYGDLAEVLSERPVHRTLTGELSEHWEPASLCQLPERTTVTDLSGPTIAGGR